MHGLETALACGEHPGSQCNRIPAIVLLLPFYLLTAAFQCLAGTTPATTDTRAREKLSRVRVGVLYENITDGTAMGRSMDETIALLKETHADLVFRSFWLWSPGLETPEQVPPELLQLAPDPNAGIDQIRERVRAGGHFYQELERSIAAVKRELPHIIFVGAIPAQRINRIERDPVSGRILGADETWSMALDPQKWKIQRNGKPVTKEELQQWFGGTHQWVKPGEAYDRRKVPAYFPDLTNAAFQQLLLDWARRQIDCGADGIWIDMLYVQARMLARASNSIEHPAVKDSLAAAAKVVDEIHAYGRFKGKYVYVGGWGAAERIEGGRTEGLGFIPAKFDFVTVSPTEAEIKAGTLELARWEGGVARLRRAYGDTPIFAFIDWGFDQSPLVTFSQSLSPAGQKELLKALDESFARLGIKFIYPLHGGYLGKAASTSRLAFGKFRIYDSLAPEFDTYPTIKELARNKAGGDKP